MGRFTVADITPILLIQDQLLSKVPSFSPNKTGSLHLTLAHFGKPNELYDECRKHNPELSFEEFMQKFYELLLSSQNIISEQTRMPVEKVNLFGTHKRIVGLQLAAEPRLLEQRLPLVENLIKFISEVGITDSSYILDGSNLWMNMNFVPHVAIGALQESVELPDLDFSGMSITLNPSKINHVTIKR